MSCKTQTSLSVRQLSHSCPKCKSRISCNISCNNKNNNNNIYLYRANSTYVSNAPYNSKSFTILSSNQIKCWFLRRGENRSTRRKTSRSRVENQQTQPTYDAESGNRTRDTLVEGERSHHRVNPAPLRKG